MPLTTNEVWGDERVEFHKHICIYCEDIYDCSDAICLMTYDKIPYGTHIEGVCGECFERLTKKPMKSKYQH